MTTPPPPLFAIILTTYRRPELVLRSVRSVLAQSCSSWTLIAVNDSPDEDYARLESLIANERRIHYIRNARNAGKNISVNTALTFLETIGFKGHVIFLDDDDWLDPECIKTFVDAMSTGSVPWLVSARAREDGALFTQNQTDRSVVHYYWDCLITKRFTGDATHCISTGCIGRARFLTTVRNAEEWFFFAQVARHCPSFIYIGSPGTISEGYLEDGLSRTRLSLTEKLGRYRTIVRELSNTRSWNVAIITYMILRLGKIFL